ncbi:MAG: carboxylating nicotinate-nucleotide diphosphorylase [Deltaproteobacteria bacterium]|nr:carboxylating nicotinate-nucleotide diphosphorylase [Deltaproteobacteria bacterium]
MLDRRVLHRLIGSAFREDIGFGDITTTAVLAGTETGTAKAIAKSELVVAGIDVFREAFSYRDRQLTFTGYFTDGQRAGKGEILAETSGALASILTAERVALNFFQRMCGIATLTEKYVDQVRGTHAKILDTRKTVPGLRYLDKYAVKIGGGLNHRFGLYDGVLVKDNHIAAAGGITEALVRVRGRISHTLKVEVEVKNLQELEEAVAAGADVIMLDNMTIDEMGKAVSFVNGRVPLEASGNVTLANVKKIAETGVDFISVGMLTHSVSAADISLKIE